MYEEAKAAGNEYRARALSELNALIEKRMEASAALRHKNFAPDTSAIPTYEACLPAYREQLTQMLGWPLTEALPEPVMERILVAEDELGKIYRCTTRVMEGLSAYGMLFVPPGNGPFPVVVVQHGGLGTPERIAGFFGSANYNDMLRRVLRQGVLCYAPQLYLWSEEFGPTPDRVKLDTQLKFLGGSTAALEVAMIRAGLTAVLKLPEADPAHAGMIGLSYGGFYTLLTAALEPRFKVAAASCSFNDRTRNRLPDWVFFDSAHRFTDSELARMVCPRPFYAEGGDKDPLFDPALALPVAQEVAQTYAALGIPERFTFRTFTGEHEFSNDPDSIRFFLSHLKE